jgi:hypothetical protein
MIFTEGDNVTWRDDTEKRPKQHRAPQLPAQSSTAPCMRKSHRYGSEVA